MILQEPSPAVRSNMIGICIIGQAPLAGRWARALDQAEGARLVRSGPLGEPWAPPDDMAPLLEHPATEAVILADPFADVYSLARRALLAGKHVLFGGPFLLGANQTAMLASLARRLNLALAKLPVKKREIIILSRFQNLKYKEIAELMGCHIGTVKAMIHRSVKDLGKAYLELSGGVAS